ncbi:MAG: glycosyltransferase [Gemmatimonadales bacterium]
MTFVDIDPTRPPSNFVKTQGQQDTGAARDERLAAVAGERPEVRGKFIFVGDEKIFIRGVTYGPFAPDAYGSLYHDRATVAADFAEIARMSANAIRTYTVPPRWLLDVAHDHGLRVMVGFGWEQHVTFLERNVRKSIEARVRDSVRECAGHPALLSFTIGNEIPSSIVRWYGPEKIERFLKQLYAAVKEEDPGCLVSYVNYPTTEYLKPPGDFVCFNVFLESQPKLTDYLKRLHNLSGDRPLVLAEIGLDSIRHGEDRQAETLAWQIRTAFSSGCAGAFTFSWTDEWHRGGADILDWGFGLTTRDRRPKRAMVEVARAFAEVPFGADSEWPRISVVVCTYNGSRTIAQCCEGIAALDYPDFETIVVDDGSVDNTAAIVSRYPGVRLVQTKNQGLSAARNAGANAATGEIVAYIDDDAWPDQHWLRYLALAFRTGDFVGVGGPNIAPPDNGETAEAVANAPGGPIHVLLTDDIAEHIPGCNMSFRRSVLQEVGGFDPNFRVAGDDVDVCWRIQERGWTLGFTPAALVWHQRRSSARAYLRQQWGYGKAEAMLEKKWPEKYNSAGHVSWAGRIYADHLTQFFTPRRRIYHGTWGSALFQSVYQPLPRGFGALLSLPEWYLIIVALLVLSVVGLFWAPLLVALPLVGLALGASLTQAAVSASRATFPTPSASGPRRAKRYLLTGLLHFLQPMARLHGRLQWGLSPWRHTSAALAMPRTRIESIWSEGWKEPAVWLSELEADFRDGGTSVLRGGDFDRWDLELRRGLLASARLLLAIEEHGQGRQLARFKFWPLFSPTAVGVATVTALLSATALAQGNLVAGIGMGIAFLVLAIRSLKECASAMGAVREALTAIKIAKAKGHASPNVTASVEAADVDRERISLLPGARLTATERRGRGAALA